MYPVRILRTRIRERLDQLRGQSAPTVLVSDNFNDNAINYGLWHELGVGEPGAVIRETGGRLRILSTQAGMVGGLELNDAIELDGASIRVNMEQTNWNFAGITLVPDGGLFTSYATPDGYTFMLWSISAAPSAQSSIRRNGASVYGGAQPSNPMNLEIQIKDGEIIFYANGAEIYREAYQASSTFCTIVLWGQSGYLNASGYSYFDNLIGDVTLPDLSITVDKVSGMVGETFTFSGDLLNPGGSPIPSITVSLMKQKVIQSPVIYPMPDPVEYPYSNVESYPGRNNQISPAAEIWYYAPGVAILDGVYASPALGNIHLFGTLQECRDELDTRYPIGSPELAGTDSTDAQGVYAVPWAADEEGTFQFYSEATP